MHEDHKLNHIKDGFMQFVADSIYHNIDTLDGISTFHGMSISTYLILYKDLPDKGVKPIPTILKQEATKGKDSMKCHWYQQKDFCLLSKKY